MKTPNDRAGHLTEQIMVRAQVNIDDRKADKFTAAQYNAIYEAVYETLREEGPC